MTDQYALPEFARVRTTRQIGAAPEGSVGTIVYVYPTVAYEVEFLVDGHHVVETCVSDDICLM